MIILEASELGMCFGVRDALELLDRIAEPDTVTIHGELVHNGEVLSELDRRGFHRTGETDRPLPTTKRVMVTAHGISDRERSRLEAAGKQLIDTTCPLVKHAHDVARQLEREGRRVIVIGKPDHVEVRGITGDLENPIVVSDESQVKTWPETRFGIVCQTTTREHAAARLVAVIRRRNPRADIAHRDTICSPTKARVQALRELVSRTEVLVVVGGAESNNTAQLAAAARRAGITAYHVERASDLRADWFRGRRTVGLTAGTSTLDRTIAAVRARLESFAARAQRQAVPRS